MVMHLVLMLLLFGTVSAANPRAVSAYYTIKEGPFLTFGVVSSLAVVTIEFDQEIYMPPMVCPTQNAWYSPSELPMNITAPLPQGYQSCCVECGGNATQQQGCWCPTDGSSCVDLRQVYTGSVQVLQPQNLSFWFSVGGFDQPTLANPGQPFADCKTRGLGLSVRVSSMSGDVDLSVKGPDAIGWTSTYPRDDGLYLCCSQIPTEVVTGTGVPLQVQLSSKTTSSEYMLYIDYLTALPLRYHYFAAQWTTMYGNETCGPWLYGPGYMSCGTSVMPFEILPPAEDPLYTFFGARGEWDNVFERLPGRFSFALVLQTDVTDETTRHAAPQLLDDLTLSFPHFYNIQGEPVLDVVKLTQRVPDCDYASFQNVAAGFNEALNGFDYISNQSVLNDQTYLINAFVLSDAWLACETFVNTGVLTFDLLETEVMTQVCTWSVTDPEYSTDPCCNTTQDLLGDDRPSVLGNPSATMGWCGVVLCGVMLTVVCYSVV